MRRISGVFLFIGLLFLGDRLAGLGLAKVLDKSQFRYSRLYNGGAEAEILLVGNSRGLSFFQSYIEEVSDKSTFNLSYNGMPVDLMKVLIEDYLQNYTAPEIAIIDITLCDRFNPELIAGFSPYVKYSTRLDSLIHKNDRKVWTANRLTHLFRYNSEVFQRALFYLKKSDEDWLLDRTITEELIAKAADPEYDFIIKYPPATLDVLNDLIKVLERADVEVRLVINPYYPIFRDKMTNLDQLKEEVEEKTGLKVQDYSYAVEGDKNFGDLQHLNKTGSRGYIDLLNQAGFFH